MTNSLQELIDTAYKIKVYLCCGSYELWQYEDGSYVDFRVNRTIELAALIKLAGGLDIKCFCDDGWLIVRLFERDNY